MKSYLLITFLLIGHVFSYEVVIGEAPIVKLPSENGNPNIKLIEGKTTLINFLGGEKKIKRIEIGISANKTHGVLSEKVVRKRFEKSVSSDGSREIWHYAPFATGTIHFEGGGQQTFAMHLSGISIAGHLFALPQGAKPQNKTVNPTADRL
jgi:hypothetical protein